ncbi:hypothetical protein EDC04DRAFT_2727050 [Pisolithus marmoratus]|nr:hypothetical protein EDC04DRAFT_2727050 [Pisolithus marmoratus]
MSSASKNPAGRPPAKILTDHFMALERVGNKSNRWYYQCNYCGPGSRIEGRDNKPLKHLLDHEKCPNAPQAVRNAVRTHLATSKGGEFLLPEPVCDPGDSTVITEQARRQNCQNGTLIGFADVPLTPAQQNNANVKLFQFVIMSLCAHVETERYLLYEHVAS